MGKKAKKTQKKAKSEPEEEEVEEKVVPEEKPEPKAKKGGKKAASASTFSLTDIFSESFRERLSQYISLNSQILALKGDTEGTDQTEEINRRKSEMADRVEGAAGSIMKEELGTLEDWIREQQEKLSNNIIQVEKAHQESKKALTGTGFFDESLVDKNLSFVGEKQSEMQAAYENYATLLKCSQDIYN